MIILMYRFMEAQGIQFHKLATLEHSAYLSISQWQFEAHHVNPLQLDHQEVVVHVENLNLKELEGAHGHADQVNKGAARDAFNWVVQQIYQMVKSCAVQHMLLFFQPSLASISLEVDLLDTKEGDIIQGHRAHSPFAHIHLVVRMDTVVDSFHLHNNHTFPLTHIRHILASTIEELSFAQQAIVSMLASSITAQAIPKPFLWVLQ